VNLRKTGGSAGFTLLEVLVTLAILSVGAALAMSLISGALGNIRKVQLRTRTIQHAETVMEMILLDESIVHSTSVTGDFEDGTRWAVRVEEVVVPPPESQTTMQTQQAEMPVKMFSYAVEVFAPESATADFRLQTMKLVNVQQALQQQRQPFRISEQPFRITGR
jgi:prepilin-type N-terminal cleavage/methylation domain-containing protein